MDHYEADKRNAARLISDAVRDEFLPEIRSSRAWEEVLAKYEFSVEFRRELGGIHVDKWESLIDAVSKTMKEVYPRDEGKDRFGELRYRYASRGFSSQYIDAFDRIANRKIGRKSDIVTFHFSEDTTVRELLSLEESINQLYRNVVLSSDHMVEAKRKLSSQTNLLRIRSFTHPGSSEVFLDMHQITMAGAVFVGLTAVALAGVLKYFANRKVQSARLSIAAVDSLKQQLAQPSVTVTRQEIVRLEVENEMPEQDDIPVAKLTDIEDVYAVSDSVLDSANFFQRVLADKLREAGSFAVVKSGGLITGIENSDDAS